MYDFSPWEYIVRSNKNQNAKQSISANPVFASNSFLFLLYTGSLLWTGEGLRLRYTCIKIYFLLLGSCLPFWALVLLTYALEKKLERPGAWLPLRLPSETPHSGCLVLTEQVGVQRSALACYLGPLWGMQVYARWFYSEKIVNGEFYF